VQQVLHDGGKEDACDASIMGRRVGANGGGEANT